MQVIPWKLPINAAWVRALDLKDLSFTQGQLVLLVEEESGALWRLSFETVQAFKIITEECSGALLAQLPEKGGLFEIRESPWIKELGEAHFLDKAHHYIVCCYDDIVEVVAWKAGTTAVEPARSSADGHTV